MATTTSPTATQAITWEEFLQLPDGDGYHRELLKGVLQVLPPAKSGHTKIAHRIFRALPASSQGTAFIEAGYKLSDAPNTWVQPDVSFLSNARGAVTPSDGHFRGAPELAVEVISPSESARDIDAKTELLLANGALAVWVVYPETRKVHVFTPDGKVEKKGTGDRLTAPFLSEGWEADVAKLFAD